MPTIGELTAWKLDPKKGEEAEIKDEILKHKCSRCVVEKRLKKDFLSGFKLLTDLQREIYKEISHRPHRCRNSEIRLFKYERCRCNHIGEVHVELASNSYGKCNMKHCPCTGYQAKD